MEEIWLHGAVGIAGLIRRRVVSSVEVVEAFLRRIAAVNSSINAVIVVAADRAIEEARAADASLARGRALGSLHGVPFTAKDVLDTAGVETSAGIRERIGVVPQADAVAVARMRRAGAILLGKTNVPPGGAGGVTDNPIHGRTNNPYARGRSPGGSSGGEAAIQGAGGSPVGLGSDSGGSLRVPAHFCGVAALKPTTGRIPNTGAFDQPGGLSDTRTQIGPLSRFVQDLAPVLQIVAGPDGRDSGVVPVPVRDPEDVELAGLRVAFYTDDGVITTTSDTAAAVRDAAGALAAAGAQVTEACPDRMGQDALDITQRYWAWEALPGGESVRLLADWDGFRTMMLAFMDSVDIIVCPTGPGPADLHGESVETMFHYTLPFSLSGQPCVVVPSGRLIEGLPIGVQVVGSVWRDDVAIAAAQRIERTVGGWRMPPL
ncbi:MAG: amidase [Actinomycetota bacterium]